MAGTRFPEEENAVKCVICRHGETQAGLGTITLERGQTTVVFKRVPCQTCANCGERYFDEATSARLLEAATMAAAQGVQVDVRDYVAA